MKRSQADGADTLVAVGILLLGAAVGLWFGWPAVLAYVGMVLVIVGLALATRGSDAAG